GGSYGARLNRKISGLRALVSGPLPKSTVPMNEPVTTTLPLVSTATAFPVSMEESPKVCDQRCAPADENFATKMSQPWVSSIPPPKSADAPTAPVITTLPLRSTATPAPQSSPASPNVFTHTGVPADVNFARKISLPLVWGIHPVPKLSQLPNRPVTTTLPAVSMATALPESVSHPPALLDHSAAPVAEYFVTKMALPIGLVRAPAPKSTVPAKVPVTAILPLPSTATPKA